MATAKKTAKRAKSQNIFTKKRLIVGLVVLSVLANIVFIALVGLIRYTNYFDYSAMNLFIYRNLDDDGCIKPGGLAAQYPPDPAKYGAGAKYCLDLTPLIVSPDGRVIIPESLKGQKIPLHR